jgi:predicted nuclease of predicted toxin-antitoxin system
MRALNSAGPAVIWVRLGNTTRQALRTRFAAALGNIVEALQKGETIIEVSDR